MGLLAGKNDIELLEKTKEGRNINRHYYSLTEIEAEVKRPIVQKLFALLRFRNTNVAFNGDFSVKQSADNRMEMSWENEKEQVKVRVEINTEDKSFEIFLQEENKIEKIII